jgi:hypothetical protein
MLKRTLALVTVSIMACGGEKPADETARDLSLAPAESVAALNDRPVDTGTPTPVTPTTTQPTAAPAAPAAPAPAATAPARPATVRVTAGAGTVVMLAAGDTLTSRHNKRGETVVATATEDVQDARGRTVVPAGAVFSGTITDIAPAGSPGGEGRLVLSFNTVEFGGKTYAIAARTDSVGSYMKGRGVTGGDAAKVGAATAVGAAAGAIIGKDVKGAVIGGAVGAAAGVGIAAATRDIDIILAAGAPIRLVLTAPLEVVIPNR